MQLVLDLPESAFSALRLSPREYLDELRRAAAAKWYEMKKISQGKGAELCGVSRAEFIRILGEHGVSVMQDDATTLRAEVEE